jgi:hypothetical protein
LIFHVFIDGVKATARYHPQSSTSSLSAIFCSCYRYRSRNGKVQLGISVYTSVNPFFAFWISDLSCDIFLCRDWFNYVSTTWTFPNEKFHYRKLSTLTIDWFRCFPWVGVRIEVNNWTMLALSQLWGSQNPCQAREFAFIYRYLVLPYTSRQ